MSARRWWWRSVLAVLLVAAVLVVSDRVGAEPEPVRVALLVCLAVVLVGLVLDSVPLQPPPWEVDEGRPGWAQGHDARTAANLRVLEAHASARRPSSALHDRLSRLAELVLRTHHDEALHTARARELMGPELAGVVTGPSRRLRPEEIERCVRRIEEL